MPGGGLPPVVGQWAEYRLALPLDPLEVRLEREAQEAALAARPPPPPDGMAESGDSAADGGGRAAAAAPETAPPDLHPPDHLPESWQVLPLRLLVTAVGEDRIFLELRTAGGAYPVSWPRWPLAAADGPPEPGGRGQASRVVAVDGVAVAARVIPLGLPWAEGEGPDPLEAGECWASALVPFGLVRLRTPGMDLALVGFGRHDAAPFPLGRVDLPEGFPEP